jgi:hypothetical protein
MGVTAAEQRLLKRIADRRRSIDAYLKKARPRSARLSVVTIVSSALAAVLNAGPALGGQDFTAAVAAALDLDSAVSVWRPLCALALIMSVVAAISANLGKSKNTEHRIVSAEISNSELEVLGAWIDSNKVQLQVALESYEKSVERVTFVPDEAPPEDSASPSS